MSQIKLPSEGYRAIGGGGIAEIVSQYCAIARHYHWTEQHYMKKSDTILDTNDYITFQKLFETMDVM